MAAVAEAEFPRFGFGSEQWFDQVFNFTHERRRAAEAMQRFGEAVGAHAVLRMLHLQTRSLLTEFGVGEKALTVQPMTRYTMKHIDGEWGVYAHRLDEYGEQLETYVDFDDFPEAVSDGLRKTFSSLSEADVGEGVVIVSPTELYKDYDSKGNVLNPFVVVARGEDTVEVASWFLFIDKKLSDSERAFLLNIHDIDLANADGTAGVDLTDDRWTRLQDGDGRGASDSTFAERIVKSPKEFVFPVGKDHLQHLRANPIDGDDFQAMHRMLGMYIAQIDRIFQSRFKKYLFEFDTEGEKNLRRRVERSIHENIQGLMGLLLRDDKRGFLETLWGMLSFGQRHWAQDSGRSVDDYMSALQDGLIQIAGFHPTTGESTATYRDPLTGEWIDGDACEETGEEKECPQCNRQYTGNHCPFCEKSTSQKAN
jgi:hypothetical protein